MNRIATSTSTRGLLLSWGLSLLALSVTACDRDEPPLIVPTAAPDPSAAPVPKTPDRLPPGELLESGQDVFGFAVPRGMKIEGVFDDVAFMSGRVNRAQLEKYVQARILAGEVEATDKATIYPQAYIRGRDDKKIFRVELQQQGPKIELTVRDIAGPPVLQGLSEEERWKRAGFSRDGKILDLKDLE